MREGSAQVEMSYSGAGVGLAAEGQVDTMLRPAEPLPHGFLETTAGPSPAVPIRIAALLHPDSVDQKYRWTLREVVAAIQEPWPLECFWFDLPELLQSLPDLDPAVHSVLLDVLPWGGEPVKSVHLYTDGSAGIAECASWALICHSV